LPGRLSLVKVNQGREDARTLEKTLSAHFTADEQGYVLAFQTGQGYPSQAILLRAFPGSVCRGEARVGYLTIQFFFWFFSQTGDSK
jgi:hypothetical protein